MAGWSHALIAPHVPGASRYPVSLSILLLIVFVAAVTAAGYYIVRAWASRKFGVTKGSKATHHNTLSSTGA